MCSHSALVKPSREQVFAEYAGQRHLLLHDGQIQGETVNEQQQSSDLWFEKAVHTWATYSVTAVPLLKHMSTLHMSTLVQCSQCSPSGQHVRTASFLDVAQQGSTSLLIALVMQHILASCHCHQLS